ncbi:toxin [Xanthomonas perforans]|uniref:ImmA/IrrE family metallo-endopeptidase n=1 Tax=Xanthomonas perforans TaxID=442694 RepID=UPI000FFEBAC5|nr:ImmA/IrrE family metallo-endopeptidase [Xanthomonas perforans]RXD35902.1 toxin [Xanthomonas perforans]RXD85157.1 toxin [Xanthomonas perforans]
MTKDLLTPSKAAFRLTHLLNAVSAAHGDPRFPVDVVALAKGAAEIFRWDDPITNIESADIKSFEGALFPNDTRSKWMLLYNQTLKSAGRIRFTQAHELGHYLLHRQDRIDGFQCSAQDMVSLTEQEASMEAQANAFAATLLMPLDDFREKTQGGADFEVLAQCADRYGVSLTAAALRWIDHTDQCAVLISHTDGLINWSVSSKSARAGGAFFRPRRSVVAIGPQTLAANDQIIHERLGVELPANAWFEHAEDGLSLKEMKITADQFDYTLTLLLLPMRSRVWEPWKG